MDVPDAPSSLRYILGWYYELSSRRAVTMAGAQAISYTEIDAWARRLRIDVDPTEVSIICRLDDIFRISLSEKSRADTKTRAEAAKSAQSTRRR